MAEKSFDEVLRQALLDANWRQWQPLWEGAEEPEFSPDYRRWRLRLLSDPFGWVKKQLRPLWARVLRTAACLLLASAVALGSLMAVSPTVRAAVLGWLREITGDTMRYFYGEEAEMEAYPSNWRISWLPDGWRLVNMDRNSWMYEGPEEQGILIFSCYTPGNTNLITNVGDVDDAEAVRSTVAVGEYSADYYESEGYRVLLWENEDEVLFILRADTTWAAEDFFRIAESIAPYSGPDTAYTMGWVPPEYEAMSRDELIGAAQEEWTFNRTSLTWRYLSDPLCDFILPDGEPEQITEGDFTGLYWAAEEELEELPPLEILVDGKPVESSGSSIVVGGSTITNSGAPSAKQKGTLLWEDSETHTVFLLEGALDREDLLRMAQSVEETAPDPSDPSHNSMLIAGTSGSD